MSHFPLSLEDSNYLFVRLPSEKMKDFLKEAFLSELLPLLADIWESFYIFPIPF